jgi:hypothetical protein
MRNIGWLLCERTYPGRARVPEVLWGSLRLCMFPLVSSGFLVVPEPVQGLCFCVRPVLAEFEFEFVSGRSLPEGREGGTRGEDLPCRDITVVFETQPNGAS